ncbi:bifunctional diaminohydroxyphosphoribosylaminopyrimidine deaminase/5-amino-6-(5-phosphoribosylamino)uracil reductase RibD [Fictibacillus barbaricus]|uniref:Riboflavin biosynthesis protein RibD n=1 Tax=Fictibacillus barbaricus TaxID=182136 RepID=A0ABS2Z9U0_9BACL|nr:bifunctional diaminohydroxyphosphoribosylaminopyrimidine deaminase/5-amino-6-(5-phosphoribosylamino)uracil reductase RibD [Fictibacillus barbaricus]MBN3544486.1 bifunctional diaminohydroxyphosphoribosylaminopyrimidine deaminase/5-amino-6-(5-phosphoribosylamino)uracil reductase RibD [Fictibacillus barbaricus]GGB66296.1 diaminohydroxyphosphoribosylaminopyrimidine deaminase [Fictibacillus barbaricus]
MSSHEFYMQLALNNAKAMKGQTDPNPLVGSVIVNDNRIVGIGTHLKAGEPHAEIHAIRMAGEKAKGGTIYVTLEPCSHHGRTGPCAVAIVEAGIKKAVIAALDPNPLVSGRGVQILKDAGIEVEAGILQEQSQEMNEVFNKFIVEKTPFVTLKSGITLDGKIASHTNNSKWITSPEARNDVHKLRNENQAILVGVNTVIHDDPELTTRIPNGRNPLRIIMDSTLKIPLHSKVVTDNQADTWVFTSENHDHQKKVQLEEHGVKVFIAGESRVSPKEVLRVLGDNLISSLLIEGGGSINAAFLENKLVDKAVFYMAPKLIGGQTSPSFFGGKGIELMADAIRLENMKVTQIGPDFKFTSYPKYE